MTAVETAPDVASAPSKTDRAILDIPLDLIDRHPLNRDTFDQAELVQLTESVRTEGVHTICLVRPKKGGRYELIAGERRSRAAKAAGFATLPCEVRVMTDEKALAVLIMENRDREDVHPMVEAVQYEALIKQFGHNRKEVSEIVKRGEDYVRDRLRLLTLNKYSRKLFLEGRFQLAHAIPLARLTPADQDRATGGDLDMTEEMAQNHRHSNLGGLFTFDFNLALEEDDDRGEGKRKADPWLKIKTVSPREFERWIAHEVRLDVKAQPDLVADLFPETEELLKEVAGNKLQLLQLTTNYVARPDAKDPKGGRVIGSAHWKRADGEKGSKKCPRARAGFISSGVGQGEAFLVCIDKKGCGIHWKQEQAEAKRRATFNAGGGSEAQRKREAARQAREREESANREREEARWKKALPAIVTAGAEALAKVKEVGPQHPVVQMAFKGTSLPSAVRTAKTWDEFGRKLALHELGDDEWYDRPKKFTDKAKAFGIDARKIVDQVAPKKRVGPVKARPGIKDFSKAACEVCDCTEMAACDGGCSWDPEYKAAKRAVCSNCTTKAPPIGKPVAKAKKLAGDVRRAKARKKGAK